MNQPKTTPAQNFFRVLLSAMMVLAGTGHLSFARKAFQAQVPDLVNEKTGMSKDLVVVLSGYVEILFGLTLAIWVKERLWVGIMLAVFYLLIFPGNISQLLNRRDAFGLDTDAKRTVRLFFQPVLIAWALWSTGALKALFRSSGTQD